MKVMICPECKDVIPEGQLRGNHKLCKACATRYNRDDLLEIDTKNFTTQKPNGLHSDNSASSPVLLQEISLVRFAHWDESSGWNQVPTLIIQSEFDHSMFLFASFWTGFSCLFLCIFLFSTSMLTDPSGVTVGGSPGTTDDLTMILAFILLFVAIGVILFIVAIRFSYCKTWIQVTPDSLIIERGLYKSGSTKTIIRNHLTSVTMEVSMTVNNESIYAIYISDGKQVKVMNGLKYDDANELVSMLKKLLKAQV